MFRLVNKTNNANSVINRDCISPVINLSFSLTKKPSSTQYCVHTTQKSGKVMIQNQQENDLPAHQGRKIGVI